MLMLDAPGWLCHGLRDYPWILRIGYFDYICVRILPDGFGLGAMGSGKAGLSNT